MWNSTPNLAYADTFSHTADALRGHVDIAYGRRSSIGVYGQEFTPTTWRLVAMNMADSEYDGELFRHRMQRVTTEFRAETERRTMPNKLIKSNRREVGYGQG